MNTYIFIYSYGYNEYRYLCVNLRTHIYRFANDDGDAGSHHRHTDTYN